MEAPRDSPEAPESAPGALQEPPEAQNETQEVSNDPQEAPNDPQEARHEPQEGQSELREVPAGFRERLGKDFRGILKQRDATETPPTQIAGEGATRLLSRFWGGPRHSRLAPLGGPLGRLPGAIRGGFPRLFKATRCDRDAPSSNRRRGRVAPEQGCRG